MGVKVRQHLKLYEHRSLETCIGVWALRYVDMFRAYMSLDVCKHV